MLEKYGVRESEYYYTVLSGLKHKNLRTLLLALAKLKEEKSSAFLPLVVSGVKRELRKEAEKLMKIGGIEENIIFTDFISNEERNLLYKNCKAFLFPSLFEGFGMPPVEAMAMGVPVLAADSTSVREVTGGLASYVEDAKSVEEWAGKMNQKLIAPSIKEVDDLMKGYAKKKIASEYVRLIVG